MATNFPNAQDNASSLPNPAGTNPPNNPDHAGLHVNANDAIKAVQAKLGIGASVPAANQILMSTGPGVSAWGQLNSTQLANLLSDKTGTGAAVFNTTPTLVSPKIDSIQEATANNGVTIDGVTMKDGVIATVGAVGATAIADGSVGANELSATAIKLGYAFIAADFSTTSTTPVAIPNLFASVTIPSGSRGIEIIAFARSYYNTANSSSVFLSLWDGAVGTGTKLAEAVGFANGGVASGPVMAMVTPANGAKTYRVGIRTAGTGTALLEAGVDYPAFILVKAI